MVTGRDTFYFRMYRHALLAVLMGPLLFAARIEQIAGGGESEPGAGPLQLRLVEPFGVDFDAAGNWYIIEFNGNRLLRVTPKGATALLASSEMKEPHGIAITRSGRLFVADTHRNRIAVLDLKSNALTSFAGTGEAGFSGDGGPAASATFNGVFAIALDPGQRNLYVADLSNRRVRRIELATRVVTTVAGNGRSGVPVDGELAAASPLVDPRAVAADAHGNIYILERSGNALRRVDSSGRIKTLIAPGQITPNLKGPKHLCIDAHGRVIIADAENHLVRLYEPATGQTRTIAGTGTQGTTIIPDDPLRTQLSRPHGVAIAPGGALIITDSYNHRILRQSGY
jgi:sugar lactone lactonase YvrE